MEQYRNITEREAINIMISLSEKVQCRTTFDHLDSHYQVHLITYKDKNGILWRSLKPTKGKYSPYRRIAHVNRNHREVLDFSSTHQAVVVLVECAAAFPGEMKINSLMNTGDRIYVYNKSGLISWNMVSKDGVPTDRRMIFTNSRQAAQNELQNQKL